MSRTYKAVQVTKPDKLKVIERAIIEPGSFERCSEASPSRVAFIAGGP